MENVMTVREVIRELEDLPPDAPVMITVVKYPAEFAVRDTDEGGRWDLGTDVECHPLEDGEITLQQGLVYFTTELTDYEEARAHAAEAPRI